MRMKRTGSSKALVKCIPGLLAFGCAQWSACLHHGPTYAYLIAAGLLLCCVADYLLEFWFVPGVTAFGAAHLLFTLGFLLKGSVHWWNALIFVSVFSAMFAVFFRHRKNAPKQAPFFAYVLYVTVLSLMLSLAVSAGVWYALGAALFVFSDLLLGLRLFDMCKSRPLNWILMAAYYLALLMIAAGNA